MKQILVILFFALTSCSTFQHAKYEIILENGNSVLAMEVVPMNSYLIYYEDNGYGSYNEVNGGFIYTCDCNQKLCSMDSVCSIVKLK